MSSEYYCWYSKVEHFILDNYGQESGPCNVFKKANLLKVDGNYEDTFLREHYKVLGALKACKQIPPNPKATNTNECDLLMNLFNRFHAISRQLTRRHNNRSTLEVKDEYDVQDLLHAFLKLHFGDIRAEEWCPSYAGKSNRMDFLLKESKTVVEVKMTRPTLNEKEIGTQLIDDIARYRSHPDCSQLICFVYDPEAIIGNPEGLERDLSNQTENFSVKVIIRPK